MTAYSPPLVEHLVMVGPDWWSCLCWDGEANVAGARGKERGVIHAAVHDAEAVTTDWGWDDVSAVGTPGEVHRWLWEQNAI